jgi:alkylation response protein AidB-like acyl-CoA dehydrogenase
VEFAFSDEQEMLRDTARRLLADASPMERVRVLMESDEGFDAGLWEQIADLGWQAMAIPEQYGGAGFTLLEQAILMEEMGRVLFPAPFLSSIVLGADLVVHAGSEGQKRAILPLVAAGTRRLAVAHLEASGDWDRSGIEMAAAVDGEDLVLTGTKTFVLDGHTAHTLIVAVLVDGAVRLLLVDGDAPGVERRRLETLDRTRAQAEIRFDAVRVPGTDLLDGAEHGWDALSSTLTRAVVQLACEQVGGARRCLEMAVDYAKARHQFGRPIGSFQAIKHLCADMLVRVESAVSAAHAAGRAMAEDADDLEIVAPLAKSYCSSAYSFCAAENIQVHGGIGFTWEHDAHLYFRRAESDALLFGTPAAHRARLARRLDL